MNVDIVIVGTQKCGTTSLHRMLAQHPEIRTHGTGQWPYFLHEDDYAAQYDTFMSLHFDDGEDERMTLVRDTSISASSPALSRLAELSPGAKLILMIRNPVDRAYSAYTFARMKQYDVEPEFDDGILEQERFADDINRYLVRNYVPLGFYHRTIKRIEKHFPKSQVLILKAEDLKAQPQATLDRIHQFLGLDPVAIEVVETNRTRRVRGGVLQRMTKTDNAFRIAARTLLPLSIRQKILRAIAAATTSSKAYEPMAAQTRKRLENIFRDDLTRLKADYSIDYLQDDHD